jgi:hypothetical protein
MAKKMLKIDKLTSSLDPISKKLHSKAVDKNINVWAKPVKDEASAKRDEERTRKAIDAEKRKQDLRIGEAGSDIAKRKGRAGKSGRMSLINQSGSSTLGGV